MTEPQLISREEAIEAIRRCGFTVQPDPDYPDDTNVGRTLVHSQAGGGGFLLGCDMDIEVAIAAVDACLDNEAGVPLVGWVDTMFGRCLCFYRANGNLLRLDTVTP